MFQIVGLLLATLGLVAVIFFVTVFFGFQVNTLFTKTFKVLSYNISIESTKGKELTIKVSK